LARFAFIFLAVQFGLFALEMLEPVRQAVINPWTSAVAAMSVWIVSAFDADVQASGAIMRSLANGFAVEIQAGCNGVEACITLAAAIVAFPASWRYRIAGLVLGFIAVQALNLVRVISLFYLGQWNMKAFEFAHLYLWQALILIDALVVFLVWARHARAAPPREGGDGGVPAAREVAVG
jgi:exosortase H (IPTLxxWG-CTERM-specific)